MEKYNLHKSDNDVVKIKAWYNLIFPQWNNMKKNNRNQQAERS